MTDFVDLTEERIIVAAEMIAGNPKPLANYLAKGGDLHDEFRELLVQFLNGKIKNHQVGPRQHTADKFSDMKAVNQLRALQYRFALTYGRYRSYTRAIAAYAEINGMTTEAVKKKYAKGGLLPDAFLAAVDKSREV